MNDKHSVARKNNGLMQLLIAGFLYGDVWWAKIRLFFLIVMMDFVAIAMVATFEEITLIRIWHNLVFPSFMLVGIILICVPIIRDVIEFGKSDSQMGMRVFILIIFVGLLTWIEIKLISMVGLSGPFIGHYLLAPLAVLVGALMAAAKYIQDIYSLESYSLALLYLISSFWGIAYPRLTISDGQRQIEIDKVNRLDQIGGPGYITVSRENAILIHERSNTSKVYSAQQFFIRRFGYITSVVELQDQRESVASVSATTKDGITITVRDIELRYRILTGHQVSNNISVGPSHVNPYPFTLQAVLDNTHNRSVTDKGLTPWFEMVKNIVVGKITEYIAEHQFDQIVTPNYRQADPREQIRAQLLTPETQNKLKDIGTQLLWCDIGHFEEDGAVFEQRLETWSAKWIGSANVIRAEGEAQRIAYQELGRAEAQADMLMSIIHAFDDLDLAKENRDQNLRNVILMRTAQVLEALTTTRLPASNKQISSSDFPANPANKEEKQT